MGDNVSDYYNEFEPFVASWLRNLMAAGLIPAGDVDERDIREVQPDDLRGYRRCHFFAGIGGWAEALRLAAWPEDVPVWTGSCPCQPFSNAGKQLGTADERHLWPEFRRLIAECRPPTVFIEQVASKAGRAWLAGVRADLEGLDYAFGAADLCAPGVGAPHIRQRLWGVADTNERKSRHGDVQSGWQHGLQPESGGIIRLEHAEHGRSAIEESRTEPRGEVRGLVGRLDESAPIRRCEHRLESESRRRECATGPSGGDDCRVGQSDGAGSLQGRTSAEGLGHRNPALTAGDSSRLGEPNLAGLPLPEQGELPGPEQLDEGRATLQSGGTSGSNLRLGYAEIDGAPDDSETRQPHSERSGADFWSDSILWPCADGKSRRVGSGVQPLAHGIPTRRSDPRLGFLLTRLERLGHDTKAARRILRDARRCRVGRLRGYGNAIVPEVAAEFIGAYLEVSGR